MYFTMSRHDYLVPLGILSNCSNFSNENEMIQNVLHSHLHTIMQENPLVIKFTRILTPTYF